jgi:hypothetical protein
MRIGIIEIPTIQAQDMIMSREKIMASATRIADGVVTAWTESMSESCASRMVMECESQSLEWPRYIPDIGRAFTELGARKSFSRVVSNMISSSDWPTRMTSILGI